MTKPAVTTAQAGALAWFCLRSQPKHEHIAAAHLRKELHLEVYLPRIRFRRPTRDGPVWFTEALFPNYLFARFDLATGLRQVRHARGVSTVVHFGQNWPAVPDSVIADLRATVGADQIHVLHEELRPGDNVRLSGGAFDNLRAVVTRLLPSRQRVAVLLEFLGRQSAVELPAEAAVLEDDHRRQLL